MKGKNLDSADFLAICQQQMAFFIFLENLSLESQKILNNTFEFPKLYLQKD